MNIAMFRRACAGAPLRAPRDHERASITTTLLHMPTPRLAQIGDADVKSALSAAIAIGGGILMVGLAQADLEINHGRFAAIVDVRLTTRERLPLRIEGAIDDAGRVAPDGASFAG